MEFIAITRISLIASLLAYLLGCQTIETGEKQTLPNKEKHLKEAAAINTQLGLAYLKKGERQLAKKKLLLALTQAPNFPDVNAAMGYFLEKSGEVREAEKFYTKALSIAPNEGAQLNNFGTFLCRQGKYKEADTYFLKATQDVRYENTAAAYENAGLCAMGIPDYDKAKRYYKKALEQDPQRRQSLYEIVNIALHANQVDEALSYLKQYADLTVQDPVLLALAIDVSNKAGQTALENDYRERLKQFGANTTGVKHDNVHG